MHVPGGEVGGVEGTEARRVFLPRCEAHNTLTDACTHARTHENTRTGSFHKGRDRQRLVEGGWGRFAHVCKGSIVHVCMCANVRFVAVARPLTAHCAVVCAAAVSERIRPRL